MKEQKIYQVIGVCERISIATDDDPIVWGIPQELRVTHRPARVTLRLASGLGINLVVDADVASSFEYGAEYGVTVFAIENEKDGETSEKES